MNCPGENCVQLNCVQNCHNSIGHNMSDILPTRISLAEIEKKKDEIPIYAVLPIPPFGDKVPFETIGRTTFKKFIRQTYDRLQSRNELPASGYCTHIPFVILPNCKEPYVVRMKNEPSKTPANALIKPGTSLSKPANIMNENVVNVTKSNVKTSDNAPTHTEMKRFQFNSADLDITITNDMPRTFYNCKTFDAVLLNGDFWHMIVIHHDRKVTKQQIIDQLFELVSDSEFFPVCYTQSKLEDFFLIRLCRSAIERLFQNNLRLHISNCVIYLSVRFQVAQFKLGQIYPAKKYTKAINEKMQKLVTCEGVALVLDLDKFANEFEDLVVNLSNKMSLQLLFTTLDTLHTNNKIFEKIRGIRLSNNNIKTLDPISKLPVLDLELVDLRHNKIRTVHELVNLKRIRMKYLLLQDNPVATNIGLKRDIMDMFPNVEKIDKVCIRTSTSETRITEPFNAFPTDTHSAAPIQITNTNDIYKSTDADFDVRKFERYKNPIKNSWHQVIISHEGKYSQAEILDAFFDAIAPSDCMPCYYNPQERNDFFFVRDCYNALEALYYKKLTIPIAGNVMLNVTLKMSVAEITDTNLDPLKTVHSIVNMNYDESSQILNLERFGENDLLENIICRTSTPRTLTNILTYAARKYGTNIIELRLGYNGLKSARGMHPMLWMKGLKEVNLSNNKIEEVKLIEPMPKGTITSLWLEGNPLCLKYTNPNSYITAIKETLPNLEMLDGHDTHKSPMPLTKQNFICSLEGYDLAEQFVQHYFTCFDSVSRCRVIKGVYHQNAVLTMSINSIGMLDNLAKRMAPIIDKCRNFKRVVYSSANAIQNVFQGPDRISSLLGIFNQTEHDFTTFTIDMTSCTANQAVIAVNGIFRETARSLNEEDVILGFARTFIIAKQAEKLGMFHASEEYQILNDIVLYYRPSVQQLNNAFKTRPNAVTEEDEEVTEDDRLGLEIIFHELTGLNSDWCKKILSAATWNFRESLESFTTLLKENKIPSQAFN